MNNQMRVAVIGAGASGMTAAIAAAECGAEVTIYEKNDRVGKKILATGNGKCNLGNLDFSMDRYYCQDREKLNKIFRVFSVWDTVAFFENCGLMIRDRNGYLYPYSEQASSVLDILRMQLRRSGVKTVLETEITGVTYSGEKEEFELTDALGKSSQFQRVIVACGGPASLKKSEGMNSFEIAQSFGHRINPIVPGLVQLKSDESFIKALGGVRCQAQVQLWIDGHQADLESGEVQFTEYGVSGIPVFQMSRQAAYALDAHKDVRLQIDLFPEQEEHAFFYMSRLRYEAQKDKALEDYLVGTANKKINMVMLKLAGLKPEMKAETAGFERIWELMKQYRALKIHIQDVNTMENAQVCAGGIDFSQVSTELESAFVKGLFFAGEILDVDGKCGGYNLQWAWTSGYVAGRNAAGSCTREIADDGKNRFAEDKEGMPC